MPLFSSTSAKRVALARALVALGAASVSSGAVAWPVLIPSSDLLPARGLLRGHLALYTWKDQGWSEVSLQIDRTNEDGDKLNWTPDFSLPERRNFYRHEPPPREPVGPLDLFVVNERELGPCRDGCEKALREPPPCGSEKRPGRFLVEIFLPQTQRSAFLADCRTPVERKRRAVTVDMRTRTLQSDLFRYVYAADNNMLFDEFSVRESDGSFVPLLTGSEFHLYVKPKVFFPLHFTRSDITSKLIGYTSSPLSTTGELSFELKVLMFKVSLDLMSTVSMYDDAIEVPVLLNLPVSGSMLREGSGVYYGFNHGGGGDLWKEVETDLPRLPRPGHDIPFAPLRSFSLKRGNSLVLTSIRMPDTFREMNFSPALATPSELREWDFPKTSTEFGVFYDVTRLRKGSHRLSVWFLVGTPADEPLLRAYAREGIRYNIQAIKRP